MAVQRIAEFDTWREGYAGATVTIYRAGSSILAALFSNEALTTIVPNPMTLISLTKDERRYGKFATPVYTEQAVEIQIDGLDSTGVIRPPITDMDAEDVSGSVVVPDGASEAHTLGEHLSRVINVRDYGQFIKTGETGASSLTNTTSIETAIGAAGAQGGGVVMIPSGVYDVIDFIIPPGVVVEGQGQSATFLQTTYAGPAFGLTGNRCGFRKITLDGVSQEGNSVGVYGIAADETVLSDVTIKRFETGLYMRGGERGNWQGFSVSDCIIGAKLHGDLNAGAGGGGEVIQGNRWSSGLVELCQDAGIELKRIDAACAFNSLEGITFRSNTGIGLRAIGARSTTLDDCIFSDNLVHMLLDDVTPANVNGTIVGFEVRGGQMSEGQVQLKNTLANVIFEGVEIIDTDIILTSPQNNVLAIDCREDTLSTVSGAATHWTRASSINYPAASFGLTGGNAATKAWATTLKSGQQVMIEAKVLARQRNGTNRASFWLCASARRAPATLAYDTQTANFTPGNILTGATSGATARIIADNDSGLTGSLALVDVRGTFVDNEIITDGASGSAMANGSVTEGVVSIGRSTMSYDAQTVNFTIPGNLTGGTSGATAVLVSDSDAGTTGVLTITDVRGSFADNEIITGSAGGSATVNGGSMLEGTGFSVKPIERTDATWGCAIIANGPEVEIRVLGASGQTIEWTVEAAVTST